MNRPVRSPLPIATITLAVGILAVFGVELVGDGMALCVTYGLVPARPTAAGLVTSLFLHDPQNMVHVGGNLAFLVLFGGIVEREIGSLRFLGLFLAAGLAGAALHVVVDASATAPLVGASGAIFGVMAVAGVLRPRLLGFVVAFGAVNVWQVLTGTGGSLAVGAHIGGLAAGTLFAVLAGPRHSIEPDPV